MRAMTYRGPGRVRVEEKPIPSIEHPNDAIVRVTCAAICGSDLHLYHGMMPDTARRAYLWPRVRRHGARGRLVGRAPASPATA